MMPAPRKRFGQHFLHDRTVIERIVATFDPKPDQFIVEIGPGRGALTLPLLDRGCAVHAIELDRDLAAQLPVLAAGRGELILHQADALTFDLVALAGNRRVRLIGNLPYNISTPLLFHLLAQIDVIDDMTLMLQKEVADRMAAVSGNKTYGRLSVMVQWRCDVERLFDVTPDSFTPPPQVHSSVLRLRPRQGGPLMGRGAARFPGIVRGGISPRRKTLRNSLRLLLDEAAFARAGIESRRRAEELTLEEFATLARSAVTG